MSKRKGCKGCKRIMLCPYPDKNMCPELQKYEKIPRYF